MALVLITPCIAGSVRSIGQLIRELDPRSILLFVGGASYGRSGAADAVAAATEGRSTISVADVRSNPDLDNVDSAIRIYREYEPDLVIGVGGGSVIDVAKVVRSVAPHSDTALPYALGERTAGPPLAPMLAIPTTAGTGSEATHFAVVYLNGDKRSIADASMQPEYVILDPELTYSMPPSVTATTGLDALCQAIESFWSVQSTPQSREWAKRAIELALDHLDNAVNRPDPVSRAGMATAAHLAGHAINVSFTAASHALSYVLTSRYGIPHGHAVALTLGATLEYNAEVTDESCADPRGPDHVARVTNTIISMLGASNARQARKVFEALIVRVGLSHTLSSFGAPPEEIRHFMVERVNSQRLANNPRGFTSESLADMLATID
jgi:alcohol dehydrogenase class IV